MSDYLDPENKELLKDFFIEAEMQMDIMERTVLAMENDPKDHSSIDELFRAVHTLKGGAYTVQMSELGLFTHKTEDLLDGVRNGKPEANLTIINLLLDCIDVIKEMLFHRMEGSVCTKDTGELERQLGSWKDGPDSENGQKQDNPGRDGTGHAEQTAEVADPNSDLLPKPLSPAEYNDLCGQAEDTVFRVRIHFNEANPMNTIGAVQEFARLKDKGTIWVTHPDFEELYEDKFFEYVDFYLESSAEMAEVLDYAILPDVTLDVEIDILEESMSEDPSLEDDYQDRIASPDQGAEDTENTGNTGDKTGGRTSESSNGVKREAGPEKAAGTAAGNPSGKTKADSSRKFGGNTSVLRVESRRVDEILNLVSEAVINKATFNQISGLLSELATETRSTRLVARDRIVAMIEDLLRSPTLKHLNGENDDNSQNTLIRGLRKKLLDQASGIHALFDPIENQLKNIMAQFGNSATNLARNTNDLHEAILSMRMVPISQVFSRFPRLVRDLSHSLDKKVELTTEGEETEIDKSVTEELVDPLMHCVRNSMDHGIEDKELRARAAKPEVGQLKLSAVNEGSNVIIEISDDGGGIALERVRQKAVDNGLIPPDKQISDQEAFNLIFDPGFSTAKEVTNISGRGVGLDVVKRQIEKLNGAVNVWSEPGKGTKFTIRLPLTLAIIQGLLVRVRSEVYAIPITAVVESIRITPRDIYLIDNYEVISVRDDVISLLRLNRIFRLEEETEDSGGYMFVVVVGTEERRVGLMVDNLIGEEDVVIKPLVDRYTHSPGVAGATILGDGTVSLILDVSQLLDLGIQYERFVREQKRYC
ncbi:chemotaxis protein CheA [Candidatus Haliotispira prima]|uniref:Chemotaxis protein CheA n=1 Tax=Candidatus Haliotispira prima TaxID=3034016 RepID=A0ABY8MGH4_9SPIO|nr:chemotaxis protein CheA [Candidatus Haliotispira prima]